MSRKHRRCEEHLLRSNPVSKIPIILLIAWLAPSVADAGLRETLAAALKNYCVPTSGEYCAEAHKPIYRNSRCECPCADMYYDTGRRACFDCDVSTSQGATTCGAQSCSAGYRLSARASSSAGTCAAGYRLTRVDRSCSGGIGPSSCPAGQRLSSVTII